MIAGMEAGGLGEQAGLLVGDVLLAVDDVAVRAAEYLGRILNRASTHEQPRTLTLVRGGERLTLTLTPATNEAAA